MADQSFPFGRRKADDEARSASNCAELNVEGFGSFTIDQVATVGRASDCQIRINVGSVSRNHARLFFEAGHFWVKDLDSANGTTVNGKKVRLQMLADGDRLCFGEVKAQFRCGVRATGPAPLVEDPLAGKGSSDLDGTPTGGLGEPFARARPPEGTRAGEASPTLRNEALPEKDSRLQALTRKIESLQAENERLRREVCQLRTAFRGGTSSTAAPEPESSEVERLRRLVSQLERALADSNIRIRNLQEQLDKRR